MDSARILAVGRGISLAGERGESNMALYADQNSVYVSGRGRGLNRGLGLSSVVQCVHRLRTGVRAF